jgi:hypothetical protein
MHDILQVAPQSAAKPRPKAPRSIKGWRMNIGARRDRPAMKLSSAAERAIDRVKCFIKWHASQFDALDALHDAINNAVGWKRGDEFWIRPDTWRDTIFDGDEDAAQDAARTLRDLGLLRVQDNRNCQAVVCVRDRKSARAYVVKPEIRKWRLTSQAYSAYDAAELAPDSQHRSQGLGAESSTQQNCGGFGRQARSLLPVFWRA